MNIICFGLSHQQAGVEVREAFALGEAASIEAARRVCDGTTFLRDFASGCRSLRKGVRGDARGGLRLERFGFICRDDRERRLRGSRLPDGDLGEGRRSEQEKTA